MSSQVRRRSKPGQTTLSHSWPKASATWITASERRSSSKNLRWINSTFICEPLVYHWPEYEKLCLLLKKFILPFEIHMSVIKLLTIFCYFLESKPIFFPFICESMASSSWKAKLKVFVIQQYLVSTFSSLKQNVYWVVTLCWTLTLGASFSEMEENKDWSVPGFLRKWPFNVLVTNVFNLVLLPFSTSIYSFTHQILNEHLNMPGTVFDCKYSPYPHGIHPSICLPCKMSGSSWATMENEAQQREINGVPKDNLFPKAHKWLYSWCRQKYSVPWCPTRCLSYMWRMTDMWMKN